MTGSDVGRLVASVAVCQAAGLLGGVAIGGNVAEWYPTLRKPPWTPPGSVIGAVWLALFTLMGISLFLVWRRAAAGAPGIAPALVFFAAQWVLNVGWNVAFFALRNPTYGLIEIAVLWVTIAVTLILFWRISTAAGALLVPYLGWVAFAGYLNFTIWRLNG